MNAETIAHYQGVAQRAWALESQKLVDDDPALAPMLAHHFQTTGKLLRPALAIAAYDLLKGQLNPPPKSHPGAVLRGALAAEVLHNGTLIHDDLQDGDEVRRDHPTVWKAFSPYQAINAGSVLYFHMMQMLASLDLPPAIALGLVKRGAADAIEIINGQASEKDLWEDMKEEPYEAARDRYFDVVRKKTSALFTLPLSIGALMAEVPEEVITALHTVARPLGTIFQIQDDVLDLYGQKGRGDAVGNDLAEGKPSFLAIYGLYYASEEDQARLRTLIETPRDDCDPEEVTWAIGMLRECGALDAALGLIEQLRQQMLQRCRQPPLLPYMPTVIAFFDGLCNAIMAPISHVETF